MDAVDIVILVTSSGLALAVCTLAFHLGKYSSRLEHLEEWGKNATAEIKELTAELHRLNNILLQNMTVHK